MKFTSEYQIVTLKSIYRYKPTKGLVQAVPGLKHSTSCNESIVNKMCIFKSIDKYRRIGYCHHVRCALNEREDGTRVRYILVTNRIYLRN